jgi:hypothetical protein
MGQGMQMGGPGQGMGGQQGMQGGFNQQGIVGGQNAGFPPGFNGTFPTPRTTTTTKASG